MIYFWHRLLKMSFTKEIENNLVLIRGAGDLATGVAIRLHNCGFPVLMLDIEKPTVIRRTVSFAQAIYDGETTVEGVRAVFVKPFQVRKDELDYVQVAIDPEGTLIKILQPRIVVDAILAKKNLGTTTNMADFVVALGPGFEAGIDCHAVVETQRGHNLGRIIYKGFAEPNTGIPGTLAGYGIERVVRSTCSGHFKACSKIGDIVKAGDTIAYVETTPLKTQISGKVRGMLYDGLFVEKGFKVADVDSRGTEIDHTKCSDKARTISGGVLEAILHYLTK